MPPFEFGAFRNGLGVFKPAAISRGLALMVFVFLSNGLSLLVLNDPRSIQASLGLPQVLLLAEEGRLQPGEFPAVCQHPAAQGVIGGPS